MQQYLAVWRVCTPPSGGLGHSTAGWTDCPMQCSADVVQQPSPGLWNYVPMATMVCISLAVTPLCDCLTTICPSRKQTL